MSAKRKKESKKDRKKRCDLNYRKILIYRFLSIPFITRTIILSELCLIDENDEGIAHRNLLEKILKNAEDNKKMAAFWDEVNKAIADGMYSRNPFNN